MSIESSPAIPATSVRLIHVTTVPMSLGFLRGQPAYMRNRGITTEAISSSGPDLAEFGHREHVPTHAVDMPRRITPFHDLRAVVRLARRLRRIRPDIVHAQTPKGGLLGTISARLARVPVRVYHMRGLPYMTTAGWRRKLLKTTEWISCKMADRVICVSHSIRDVAVRDGVCPASKIVVIGGGSGNGVDATGRFDPARFSDAARRATRRELGIGDDDLVIGFVGRLVRDKGVNELAAAWTSIREEFDLAHLVLVGPLEPQDPVDAEMMDMLQQDARVHITGSVTDTGAMYAVFDIVVLPTYREGFPNVPLEAAAMSLPVVATDIPGCVDAVRDGVTGTLVPPGDPESLRAAIARYLRDPALRGRHGQAGRERVLREFRQEDIWQGIYEEYCRLLRARGYSVPGAAVEGEVVWGGACGSNESST